ncbi:MAG: ATP-binding protein [Acidobacteria bacterium]|nr:ATP-binding protein [Acidobacteriota bacterium]
MRPVGEFREHLAKMNAPSGVFCGCGAELSNWQKDRGVCDACGARALEERRQQRLAAEQADRDGNLREVLERAGVPAMFLDATREAWRGPWPAAALEWASEPELKKRGNLVIWGEAGTGKSHIAAVLLREHLRPVGAAGLWVGAAALLERLRHEMDGQHHGDVMRDAIEAPLIVLDDIGAEMLAGEKGEWRRDRISYLVARRWEEMRPVIATTNLRPKQFFTDPRFGSRLFSGMDFEQVARDERLAARRRPR